MGSFNVACSVSNISISSQERVALIPLQPANARYNKTHKIEPSSSILMPNTYFNPLTFPIFGKYDEYGSVEAIEENDNTRAIEKHFGMSIEQFVAVITCGRPNVNDYYSEHFNAFAVNKEAISSFAVRFDEVFLNLIGLTPIKSAEPTTYQTYSYEEQPYQVVIIKDTEGVAGYEILNQSGEIVKKNNNYSLKADFLNDFFSLTGIQLNVAKENQEKVTLFSQLSAMFVHAEIYEELTNEFSRYEKYYNDFQTALQGYLKTKPKTALKTAKGLTVVLDFSDNGLEDFLLDAKNPFNYFNRDRHDFLRYFKDMSMFVALYEELLSSGALKEETCRNIRFQHSMYNANQLFFPAMSGPQCGDDLASKKLLEKSLEIVNRRLAKQEEEEDY